MSHPCHIPVLPVVIEVNGPIAFHNMPCPVCRDNHAVLMLNTGLFSPCWVCQSKGWELRRVGRIRQWWRNWRDNKTNF